MNYLVEPVANAHWGNIEVRMDKVLNGSVVRYDTKLTLNGHTHVIAGFLPDLELYSFIFADLGVATFEAMPWIEDWMLTCTTEELREHLTESEIEELESYKYGQETRQSLIKLFGAFAYKVLSHFVRNRSDHKGIDNELDLRLALHHLGVTTPEAQDEFIYWKPTATKQY